GEDAVAHVAVAVQLGEGDRLAHREGEYVARPGEAVERHRRARLERVAHARVVDAAAGGRRWIGRADLVGLLLTDAVVAAVEDDRGAVLDRRAKVREERAALA